MYFHRDLPQEHIPSAPRPEILRLPESDSPDLFEDCAPLYIDLVSSSSDSDSTHMTLSDDEIFPPTPPPPKFKSRMSLSGSVRRMSPPPLDTVSIHSDSTHLTLQFSSEGEQWEEEGQRLPTPTDSQIEAWRAEDQNLGQNGQASTDNFGYNDYFISDGEQWEEEGQQVQSPTDSQREAWREEARIANAAYYRDNVDFFDQTSSEEGDNLDEGDNEMGDYENNVVFPLRRASVVQNLSNVAVDRSLRCTETSDSDN